ncbi:hypothetical protein [Thermoflavimicrobium dichotomicum]|uniref:hypothetical protein n=1 Tax=Thermoflavimicrobium dichotomicum TaxID=46223 RepID=UPI0011141FAD|nr:hypothetical protein [Thermoflavimicrobium dichotomicum]
MEQSQRHDPDPLTPCEELVDPYPLCKPLILEARSKWDAVVARGGLLRLIQDGTYRVNGDDSRFVFWGIWYSRFSLRSRDELNL